MKNNVPNVLDLYSGVGGLSLGVVKSGFNLFAAVEREKRIIESHARNFPSTMHINEDVSTLDRKKLLNIAGAKSEIAGIVGGPPCQGFSSIGKRNIDDQRNNLFIDFFRLVNEIRPLFFLAENVPGILNPKYDDIRKRAFSMVERNYNYLLPLKIRASDFGAATVRTRIFFIGVRNDIKGIENITAAIEMRKSKKPTYVQDALCGLPERISDDWDNYTSSWQKVKKDLNNSYTTLLNEIIEGVGDNSSIDRFVHNDLVSGCFATKHSEEIVARYANLQPGQQDKISKSTRLKNNGFCPTLRAGTDSTKGSYQAVRPIHPTHARVITPREAARLQGFPDWFQFHETKWHSFRLIGNSVCPIAAHKVLTAIKSSLNI